MLVYFVAFIFIFFLVATSNNYSRSKSLVLLAFWTVFLALVCGLKDMLGGYDCYIYSEVFDITSDELDKGLPMVETTAFRLNETELGYALFTTLIAYITPNRYIYLLTASIFIFYSLFHHIKSFTRHPIASFFILFCLFYFFTFTYLRQVLAVCIAWYAIPYAAKRRPIQFFLIVALAASFHNSAALFGLTYFIAQKRFSSNQILFFVVAAVLLGFTPISNILFNAFGGALNEEKTAGSLSHTGSARIEYIIEAIFFFVIIFLKYETVAKDAMSTCLLNISLLFIFILSFFVRFSDGGRMSWYFLIGIATTLAQIIDNEEYATTYRFIILTTVSLLYFRILFAWGGILMPYKTFLSDGVRPNDTTWETYEYDHSYDNNKFYRPAFKFFRDEEQSF